MAKDTWQVFRDLGLKSGGVQLGFTLLPSKDEEIGPNILASIPSKGGAVGCIMPVYPLALQAYASETTSGLAEFKQVIAHEMFHCFQGWNYPDHFDEWSVQRWWGEGSADYFGNLDYPDANWEWGCRFSFVKRSAEEQMFYLSYENTFFFQFLEKKIQPQGMLDLFRLLPTGEPLIEQRKVLSGYAGMSDYWHEFAQSVVDDSLIDTGGAAIPFPDRLSDTVAAPPRRDYHPCAPSPIALEVVQCASGTTWTGTGVQDAAADRGGGGRLCAWRWAPAAAASSLRTGPQS